MPLYGRGLKRASVLRLALLLNDALSRHRNRRVRADRHLPDGRILSPAELLAALPFVVGNGLQGGALWHDARMLDPKGIVDEIVRRARGAGATALANIEVESLALDGGRCAACRASISGPASGSTSRRRP